MKADAREQLDCVPLDLGDHAACVLPRLRLTAKAVVKDLGLVGRATHGAGEQVLHFPFQHGVGLDADGVPVAFVFQEPHQLRQREGRIPPEELGDVHAAIALDDRQQRTLPELGAGMVAATEHRVLQVAQLVE